jgi:DNA-directed RNA polymerase subunit RPC12/RpoP
MLASKCVKCGKHYVGWALSIPENQKCPYCKSTLAIHDDTIDLDVNYEDLYKSLYDHPNEWQELLQNTMTVSLRKGLPNTTSAN